MNDKQAELIRDSLVMLEIINDLEEKPHVKRDLEAIINNLEELLDEE